MHELIKQLIHDLSSLTNPLNTNTLNELLSLISTDEPNIPEQFALHYQLIFKLKQLVTDYGKEKIKLAELQPDKLHFDRLTAQEASLLERSNQLKEQIAQCKNKLVPLSKKLEQHSGQVPPVATELWGLNDVTSYMAFLRTRLNEVDEISTIEKLQKLKQEATALGIPCSQVTTVEQFVSLKQSSELEIQKLVSVIEQMKSLQLTFAEQLSTLNSHLIKDDLLIPTNQLITNLIKVQNDIDSHSLTANTKERLIQEFQSSSNTAYLIESYRSKIDSALSFKNIAGWTTWTTDPEYAKQQQEYNQSVNFLQLLQEERFLNLKCDGLGISKQRSDKESKGPQGLTSQSDLKQLLVDTQMVLSSLPAPASSIGLTSSSTVSDYYGVLLSNIPLVHQTLAHKKLIISKINELIVLNTELEQKKKDCLVINAKFITQEQQSRGDLEELLSSCTSYIEQLNLIEILSKEYESTNLSKEDLNIQLKVLKNKTPDMLHIASLSKEINVIEQVILQTWESLNNLALPIVSSPISSNSSSAEDLVSESDKKLYLDPFSEESMVQDSDSANEISSADDSEGPSLCSEDMEEHSDSYDADSESSQIYPDLPKEQQKLSKASIEPSKQDLGPSKSQLENSEDDLELFDTHLESDEEILETSEAMNSSETNLIPSQEEPNASEMQTEISPTATQRFTSVTLIPQPVLEPRSPSTPANESLAEPSELSSNCQQTIISKSSVFDQCHLQEWHNKNLEYLKLKNVPEEVSNWYTEVYNAILITPEESTFANKASQLLRDILFELQHKTDLAVINEYMRICPTPSMDLKNLVNLKPAFMATDASFEVNEILLDCPKELKQHYLHYMRLKKNYPFEAELFLQAIRSADWLLRNSDGSNSQLSANNIPLFAKDARYEPLKRHRGFLKIWEALEDFFRLLIGKITGQPEHTYRQRPSFFKTRSCHLIEEVDTLLINQFKQT
jgi:hypothetical protein